MKRKPVFKRVEEQRYKKLRSSGWRRPRGMHSKSRRCFKNKFPSPGPGYGRDTTLRGRHPSGYYEKLVGNERELEEVKKDTQAVRFSSRLGKRKRLQLYSKARELGLKVLNPPTEEDQE